MMWGGAMTIERETTGLSRRGALAGGLATGVLATGALATAARAQSVRVDNAAAMNGANQVAIGSFIVAFLTDRTDRARAGGGLLGGGFGGRSTARSALEGVSDADFQQATDAAYADFLSQLASAGYQVGDRTALVEAFTKNRARPLDNGLERDVILDRDSRAKAKVFSPVELGGVWLPREVLGHISAPGFSGNQAAVGISMGGTAHARATGQAAINAFYVVDFANAETYGGWFRNSSAVSVKAGLAVMPDVSKVFAYAPNGRVSSVTLREPIAVGGDFGEFVDATTRGQRTAELAANVIGVLGGIGTNSTRRYAMTADPERWRAGVSEVTTAATARALGALRSGR